MFESFFNILFIYFIRCVIILLWNCSENYGLFKAFFYNFVANSRFPLSKACSEAQWFNLLSRCRATQAAAESRASELEDQLRRVRTQADEQARQLQDANGLKAKLSQENFELQRHLQDLDSNNVSLMKAKASLQNELDDLKLRLDDETRV